MIRFKIFFIFWLFFLVPLIVYMLTTLVQQMIKQVSIAFTLLILSIPIAQAGKLIPFEDPKTKLYGFKNEKGKVVVSPQFQIVMENLKEDEVLIPVKKDGTYYLMDSNGELKFESVFHDNGWDYYNEGLTRFLKDGKVGFLDKGGNVVIQPLYDFAKYFENGTALVCNGCWSYYPKSPRFQPLSSGRYIMTGWEYPEITGGKWGVIDIKGNVVVPLEYNTYEEALKQLEPQNHVYEFLKGAELQCEDEQRPEVKQVLNDLLTLSGDGLKKKRYKNYKGQKEWTAAYFIERHFVPNSNKSLNQKKFYDELSDPRVKQVIQEYLEKMN